MKSHPHVPFEPISPHHLILYCGLRRLSVLIQPSQNLLRFNLVSFEERSEACEVKDGKLGRDPGQYEKMEHGFRVGIEYCE